MAKSLLTKLERRIGVGITPFGCPRMSSQYKGASNGVDSKEDLKPKYGFRGFGGLAYKMMRMFKPKKLN